MHMKSAIVRIIKQKNYGIMNGLLIGCNYNNKHLKKLPKSQSVSYAILLTIEVLTNIHFFSNSLSLFYFQFIVFNSTFCELFAIIDKVFPFMFEADIS